MKPNAVITINKQTDIIWTLVLIEILRLAGVDDKPIFVLMLAWIFIITWRTSKITIPRIKGLIPLIIFLIYGTFVGLITMMPRLVTRDLSYFIPTLAVIYIGYMVQYHYKDKSVDKTLMLIGAIIAINAIIRTLMLGGGIAQFDEVRNATGVHVVENCYIFALIFVKKAIGKQKFFSRAWDNIIFILIIIQISTAFGRTSVALAVTAIIVSIFLSFFSNKNWRNHIVRKILLWIVVAVVAVGTIETIFPNTIMEEYSEKWDQTSDEINPNQEFDSTGEAMGRWRAYEKQSARKQWQESNIMVEIFGAGVGKGVYVKYIPYTWDEEIFEHSIPILHNGYYMILPKGGLFGVACLIIFFFSGLFLFFKKMKNREVIREEVVLLATIGITMAVQSYMTSGMMAQSFAFAFGIIVGSCNAKIQMDKMQIEEDDLGEIDGASQETTL